MTSCSSGADANLVLPIDSEPKYLDPQIVGDNGAEMIVLNCMEGLLSYDIDGNIIEAGAESYSVSDDGLTYTFNLRKDAVWRVTTAAGGILGENYEDTFDNRVTAADYVFALQRAVDPNTKSPNAFRFLNIKNAEAINNGTKKSSELGVKADGDYTLTIKMERRDDDFLAALSSAAAVPCNKEYFNATGGRYFLSSQYMIFNGPFYLANWAEGTAITIRRNYLFHNLGDDKIKSEVLPKSVYFSFNNEQSTRAKKLKDGTYNVAYLLNEQADAINSSGIVLNSFDTSVLSIVFNCSDEICSNENLRKAISHALDYSVFRNNEQGVSGLLPSGLTLAGEAIGNNAQTDLPGYNKANAGKLFAESLSDLEVTRLNLTLLCSEENETLARTAIQSLQSAFGVVFGIDVESVGVDELNERLAAGEYQLALTTMAYTFDGAKEAINSFSSENSNVTAFSSPQLDKIIAKANTAGTAKSTLAAVKSVEKLLVDSAVIIPLREEKTIFGVAGAKGVVFYPGGGIALFKSTRK